MNDKRKKEERDTRVHATDNKKRHEDFARAAHEDDDGYDPWSDRVVQDPFWEKDPWN